MPEFDRTIAGVRERHGSGYKGLREEVAFRDVAACLAEIDRLKEDVGYCEDIIAKEREAYAMACEQLDAYRAAWYRAAAIFDARAAEWHRVGEHAAARFCEEDAAHIRALITTPQEGKEDG